MVRLELSAREAVVIELLRKHTYREVARLFNVTEDEIKRIKESAKRKGGDPHEEVRGIDTGPV